MPSPTVQRVLDAEPVATFDDHRATGGGVALTLALESGPEATIEMIDAAGLRGRGGGGFPTADKWVTVARHRSPKLPATVVVNAAEGEPGSFKDRALLLQNPYKVIEGASIAAAAVGADTVVLATKQSFTSVVDRLRRAIEEIDRSRTVLAWPAFEIVEGPDSYLFGEETALLEVVLGNPPFPRLSPPWRHGVDTAPQAAQTIMATPGSDTLVPPVLVNNVETLAHVADIVGQESGWFREFGADDDVGSGTFLCTVTGATERHGVAELPVGATLNDVLTAAGGGLTGEPLAALPGVSHPMITPDRFDDPLGYGPPHLPVGSGAFRFFTTETSPVAVAAGVARFLAVESCGQCQPCKEDGVALAGELGDLVGGRHDGPVVARLARHAASITDGARCALARQHEEIMADLLASYPGELEAYLRGETEPTDPVLIAPIAGLRGAVAELDQRQSTKQPDWRHGGSWTGAYPAAETDVALTGR